MKLIRFGLLLLVMVRLVLLWPRLRRFVGASAVSIDGEAVRYRVTREPKTGDRSAVAIGIDAPVGMRFAMHPEGQWDRAGKFLGLSREWQSGEREFDDAVYVVGDDPPLLELLSRDAMLRRQAAALVTRPDGELYCAGGRLWLERSSSGPRRAVQSDESAAREFASLELAALRQLRDRLGTAVDGARKASDGLPVLLIDLLVAVCVVVGIAGALGFMWEGGLGTPRQLVDDFIEQRAGMVFAGSTAVISLLLFALLRRASFTHLVVLELLLVGLPGAWLISHTTHQALNQALDASPPELVKVEVTGSRVTESRRRRGGTRRHYHLTMRGWPDLRVPAELEVPERLYRQVLGGACIEAVWHRGHLGDPWISSWRATTDCSAVIALAPARVRDQVRSLVQQAERSMQPQDWMRVRQVAERAIVRLPDDAWLHGTAGRAAFVARDYAGAIAHMQASAERDPTILGVWRVLGHSLMRTKRFHEAAASFSRALELRPAHAETLADLAVARINDGNRTGALEAARHACGLGEHLGCDLVRELEGRLGDGAR